MIKIKRTYDEIGDHDGQRILIDRMWPRGKKKTELQITEWLKDLAPTTELRQWFAHKPERWEGFKMRYFKELDDKQTAWQPVVDIAEKNVITLLYSASDRDYNNAVALKEYLDKRLND